MNKFNEALKLLMDTLCANGLNSGDVHRAFERVDECVQLAIRIEPFREQLAELVAVGDEATQGEFTLERAELGDGFDAVLLTFGGTLASDFSYSTWNTIKEKDARLMIKAANLRPLFKAILGEDSK